MIMSAMLTNEPDTNEPDTDELDQEPWAQVEFGEAQLGDQRRTARLIQLATALGARPHASLPEAAPDAATLKAAYRFFDNEAITPAALLGGHVMATWDRLRQCAVVLAVQDTRYHAAGLEQPSRHQRPRTAGQSQPSGLAGA